MLFLESKRDGRRILRVSDGACAPNSVRQVVPRSSAASCHHRRRQQGELFSSGLSFPVAFGSQSEAVFRFYEATRRPSPLLLGFESVNSFKVIQVCSIALETRLLVLVGPNCSPRHKVVRNSKPTDNCDTGNSK